MPGERSGARTHARGWQSMDETRAVEDSAVVVDVRAAIKAVMATRIGSLMAGYRNEVRVGSLVHGVIKMIRRGSTGSVMR